MAGGLDVHKNVHVEEWATKRENLEKVFKFSRTTLPKALIFGLAVPALVYVGCVAEFHKQDEAEKRPLRKFM